MDGLTGQPGVGLLSSWGGAVTRAGDTKKALININAFFITFFCTAVTSSRCSV